MPQAQKPLPLEILTIPNFTSIPWLVHGFSTRNGGFSRSYGGHALNLGFTKGDSRANVERNREAFERKLGAITRKRLWPLVTLRQIHSDLILGVEMPPETLLAGDGLVTDRQELLLGIQTADCLPVILADTRNRAVGVFHAGWRGTVKRIVEKGVGEMRGRFGTRPKDVKAAIGPGIHACCYKVGEEVRESFRSQFAYADELFHEVKESDAVREKYPLLFLTARAPGHSQLPVNMFLDLVEANRRQLMDAGIPARNIVASPLCTNCRMDVLFSHRGEKGVTGRMLAAVGIREK